MGSMRHRVVGLADTGEEDDYGDLFVQSPWPCLPAVCLSSWKMGGSYGSGRGV